MSQPKRWSHGLKGMSRNRSGPWVTWEDYEALAAENKRLRKAGNAFANKLLDGYRLHPFHDNNLIAAWNAAKEGRDAK